MTRMTIIANKHLSRFCRICLQTQTFQCIAMLKEKELRTQNANHVNNGNWKILLLFTGRYHHVDQSSVFSVQLVLPCVPKFCPPTIALQTSNVYSFHNESKHTLCDYLMRILFHRKHGKCKWKFFKTFSLLRMMSEIFFSNGSASSWSDRGRAFGLNTTFQRIISFL